ncbi:uncharacterized protein EAE98_005928 [Botrytis deweyae]|uniref:Methyltransferase domain-containing protein n=1 Tax=Botrytis deweyae TaxID=2478750 RepID=A0ABQ7ILK7_9HELO|nr:uncharacterized protein EAE98_005928 [Botrytis deweyae]KAF7927546.1 hypothetical protein EAE98_005928 [Botrytis deweyae]
MAPIINENKSLQDYYHTIESRLGYQIVLGGTRHFGYYERDKYNPFPIGAALHRMEDYLAKTLSLPSGSRVLDAGCGVGHVALRLAKVHSLEIQGIDVIDHHLEKARRNIEKQGMKARVTVGKMDYHHLDGIASNSLEGVYTMETFVHSTSPETVAREFYRVLKPGGRVALFEYEHSDMKSEPKARVDSWSTINKHSAMPAFDRFTYGSISSIFADAGFTNVVTEDITINVKPMVRFFFVLAYIPYLLVLAFGLQKHFVNTMAGVEGWKCRNSIKYVVVSGEKPMENGSELDNSESRKLK